jgi:hypothetical protein
MAASSGGVEWHGGYRLEINRDDDASLRAVASVVSVLTEPGSREVFRMVVWFTDHLARRSNAPNNAYRLAEERARQRVRTMLDKKDFEEGVCYRELHGFDALNNTELFGHDKLPLDLIPHPPLPRLTPGKPAS